MRGGLPPSAPRFLADFRHCRFKFRNSLDATTSIARISHSNTGVMMINLLRDREVRCIQADMDGGRDTVNKLGNWYCVPRFGKQSVPRHVPLNYHFTTIRPSHITFAIASRAVLARPGCISSMVDIQPLAPCRRGAALCAGVRGLMRGERGKDLFGSNRSCGAPTRAPLTRPLCGLPLSQGARGHRWKSLRPPRLAEITAQPASIRR